MQSNKKIHKAAKDVRILFTAVSGVAITSGLSGDIYTVFTYIYTWDLINIRVHFTPIVIEVGYFV